MSTVIILDKTFALSLSPLACIPMEILHHDVSMSGVRYFKLCV